MEVFVNRERELEKIHEVFETLQDPQRLLRTPIIEFSGVQGIGKTTLLQQIKAISDDRSILCITKNAELVTSDDFNQAEALAKKEPVVIILDSLDAVNAEQFQDIEANLSKLLVNNRLFVVVASRSIQKFEHARSIARKLTIYPLESLERESCILYLNNFANTIPSEARDMIFDWTRGYPLAMTIMTNTILNEQLDSTKAQDQRRLIRILIEEVIEKTLLANVTPTEEKTRFHVLLALLSIPRRFNLILMQDLIEQFADQYKLETSLAYITLIPDINRVTSVLSWNLERAAYCIDAPIRNLFLLQYRIEQPEQYIKFHKFLAEKNESFAQQVSGSDRIRYLREFFYHLAYSEQSTQVQSILAQQIEQLAQVQIQEQDERNLLQSHESFLQFYEEFRQDEELKEALGQSNTRFALSLVYRSFIEIYRQFPETMRESWLKKFFSLVTQQSGNDDFASIFEEGMLRIIKQVSSDEAIKLYNELSRDEDLKVLLGVKFDEANAHILKELLNEG
jgi:AAA ATPase domain